MPPSIAVVGSLNMDLIVQAPRIPAPGETILGAESLVTAPGGKGANQAVAAARLGAQVKMIGRVGADDFGQQLLNSLSGSGVEVTAITQDDDASTGVAVIIVSYDGQNSIVVSPGANAHLTPALVTEHADIIRGSDALLLQLEVPIDTVEQAALIAAEAGVRVILNPAPALPLPGSLLKHVDVLVLNETEAALLTLQPVNTQQDIQMVLMQLQRLGVETIALTRGGAGSTVNIDGGVAQIAPFVVNVVDTTAAGDAFTAGFSVALAGGQLPPAAARFGNATGALAATVLGAQPSLPTRKAVEQLIANSETQSAST